MVDDLVAFLRERLDEDYGVNSPCPRHEDLCDSIGDDDGRLDGDCWSHRATQWHTADCAAGMAQMNARCGCGVPARVLAEVDAKRRILEEHLCPCPDPDCGDCGACSGDHHADPTPAPCKTLRLLALPYAQHEDYRREWTP